MKIGLFSFVIFLVTEFSAYVCTEVDENDFGKDFTTQYHNNCPTARAFLVRLDNSREPEECP